MIISLSRVVLLGGRCEIGVQKRFIQIPAKTNSGGMHANTITIN